MNELLRHVADSGWSFVDFANFIGVPSVGAYYASRLFYHDLPSFPRPWNEFPAPMHYLSYFAPDEPQFSATFDDFRSFILKSTSMPTVKPSSTAEELLAFCMWMIRHHVQGNRTAVLPGHIRMTNVPAIGLTVSFDGFLRFRSWVLQRQADGSLPKLSCEDDLPLAILSRLSQNTSSQRRAEARTQALKWWILGKELHEGFDGLMKLALDELESPEEHYEEHESSSAGDSEKQKSPSPEEPPPLEEPPGFSTPPEAPALRSSSVAFSNWGPRPSPSPDPSAALLPRTGTLIWGFAPASNSYDQLAEEMLLYCLWLLRREAQIRMLEGVRRMGEGHPREEKRREREVERRRKEARKREAGDRKEQVRGLNAGDWA